MKDASAREARASEIFEHIATFEVPGLARAQVSKICVICSEFWLYDHRSAAGYLGYNYATLSGNVHYLSAFISELYQASNSHIYGYEPDFIEVVIPGVDNGRFEVVWDV